MKVPMSRAIGDEGAYRSAGDLKVELRLPWYRSLPLSTVEVEHVTIDNEAVPADRMRFELEGHSYKLMELPEQTAHVWYVLDSAWLTIAGTDLEPGSHEIAVTLTLYPPYIHGLKRPLRDTCTIVIEAESAHV